MIVAEKINSYITANAPSAFCDGCITSTLGLTKSQHAQQITSALGTTRDFVRENGICDTCGKQKKVTRHAKRP